VEYYGPDRWQNGKPDPRYLLNGGVRLFGVGDSADAKRLFEETLQCDRNNPDAYFNLGALCEANGQFTAAKQFFLLAKQFGMDLAAT
ncbi:tetratricopeptide repeat protein, partial [Staphylococcus aureus]